LYQNRSEPPLKDVTGFMVPSVIFLSIDAVRLAHADGQIGVGRFDHEVVMLCEVPNYVKLISHPL
jgi:hypothetical protein